MKGMCENLNKCMDAFVYISFLVHSLCLLVVKEEYLLLEDGEKDTGTSQTNETRDEIEPRN